MTQADAPTPDKPPKTKRRWLQYSLRTLLIVTTVCAVWLGWWSYRAKQQRDAATSLERAGATVFYDARLLWSSKQNPLHWPEWLLNNGGRHYFSSVNEVWLPKKPDAKTLANLKALRSLKDLCLTEAVWSETEREHLQQALPNVKVAIADWTPLPK